MKGARENAMEKLEKLAEATEEERLEWKYVPEGEKLAAKYLKQDYDLAAALSRYEEKARRYVIQGAGEILVRNIDLSKSDSIRKNNRRAMDGLKAIKTDKLSVENVYSKMRRICSHYVEQGEQQRKQAYEKLKTEFEAKMQQAIQQQLGSYMGVKIDVERQPQFQEEWRMIQAQLDLQYIKLLVEYKHELLAIL